MQPLSLYLHFPFCARKCAYCDFNSHVPSPGEMDLYLAALRREIEARAPVAEGRAVETVYFGGGTPTLYPVEDLAAVLALLRRRFAFGRDGGGRTGPPLQGSVDHGRGGPARPPQDAASLACTGLEARATPEISCEANPGTVNEAYLRDLRAAGVNRLSLGVQSFRDEELRLLGRIHTADEARQAVAAARAAGFDNLSLDLIAALPGQTLGAWEYNLTEAIALEPEHLSCYGLSIPPGTPLAGAVEGGELTPLDEDTSAAIWLRTHELLTVPRRALATRDSRLATPYDHYEVSSFARSGYQCRHNLTYWRNREYLGFGVSAASYWEGCRSVNVAAVGEYAARLERGESVTAEAECLSAPARLGETLMLGLRLAEGVEVGRLRDTFGDDLVARVEPMTQEMADAGLLEITADHWRPTIRGMLLNNRLGAAFV